MVSNRNRAIFHDPSGKRIPKFRLLLILIAGSLGVVSTSLAVSFATPVVLPQLSKAIETSLSTSMLSFSFSHPQPPLDLKHIRNSGPESKSVPRYAFYNSWDENSFYSLRENFASIDVLWPEWLHTDGATGKIVRDDARKEAETRLWLRKNAPALAVMPVLNNYGSASRAWDGAAMDTVLASDTLRPRLVASISSYLEGTRDPGIVIDFKMLEAGSLPAYVRFVSELKDALRPRGRQVLAVAPAYEDRLDLWELSNAADQVIVLAYDQHWEGGAPGPLGAQGWFEALLDRVFAANTGTKFIVAIGSYAVDWHLEQSARRISVPEAWELLADSRANWVFEGTSLNPTLAYVSNDEHYHQVWALDGVTAYNQIAAALAMKPGGLALWRLGTEDPTVWKSFARGKSAVHQVIPELETIRPPQAIVHKGEGEVLSVSDRETVGRREIEFEPAYNLITAQRFLELPKSLSLRRWGRNDSKLLALTFDDGPSETYTPQILDILREKKVKATFFVVGASAALEPRILQRIYAEGHDIGNHTFTHPNLRSVGPTLLDLELNATQRVLEAKLGAATRLFRPPFNKDAEPVNKTEAQTLLSSAALGYITIGLKIDPLDWAQPGVQQIVATTVAYAEAQRGNVILLHDGGGNRQQTVEALPAIIDQLQARGYEFVPIHQLLGLERDEVMPRLKPELSYGAKVNEAGLMFFSTGSDLAGVLFLVTIVLGIGRLVLVSAGAVTQNRRVRERASRSWRAPSLAIVVPAFNEEKVIVSSVRSLLELEDQDVRIIVIDDGSTDRTFSLAQAAFGQHPRVTVLTKPNGGKASALNFALQTTEAEIVVAIDADTRLARDAIFWLVRHFEDAAVGAVAGVVDVGNSNNLITRFQALEYVISQNLDRRAFEVAGSIIVVPGAIGAWRRAAVLAVGGYDEDTLAEDADLTLKLQRAGWQVLTEPKALASTEAPQTVSLFLRQRFRWMFGTLQVAWKHLDVVSQRGALGIKLVGIPNIVLFQFFFALIAPVADVMLVGSIVLDMLQHLQNQSIGASERTRLLLMYWLAWQALEFAVAALAFKLDGRTIPISLLPLLILQRFSYRQLIYYIAFKSLVAAICGNAIGWDKLPRRGLAPPRDG